MKLSLMSMFLLFCIEHALADLPVAGFSYYIEFVGVGADVSFLNESVDADSYAWDFGDGSTSAELHPFHHYTLPGVYTVCLTATNAFGSSTFCDTLITYYAPSADFAFSGDPVVSFTDLSTNFPTSWDWFFGDGDISAETNPTHTFLTNGTYNTCLSVGNPGGTNYTCKTVTISSYAVTEAAFSFSGDPEVVFEDNSTHDPFAWHWEFGDGGTSEEQDPTHTFADNGIFTVCLTATNAGGTNTVCQDVSILYAYPFPEADFTYLTEFPGVAFVDISTNDPISWTWDFGDGNTSSEQNPIHVYAAEGNYTVCLTAVNIGGPDTECKELFLVSGIDAPQTGVRLFPNPIHNTLQLFSDVAFVNADITVYDALGIKIIQQGSLQGKLIQIPFTSLPSGIYSIQCTEAGTFKFSGMVVKR